MKKKIIIIVTLILIIIICLSVYFIVREYNRDGSRISKNNSVIKDSLSKCNGLSGNIGYMTNKDRCLLNVLGKIGKNPDYLYVCSDFTTDNLKIECKSILSGDMNICSEMNPIGYSSKDEVVEACYYAYAQSQGFKQKDTCKKISNSLGRNTCYFQYFEATGDKSICKEITDQLYLEECK